MSAALVVEDLVVSRSGIRTLHGVSLSLAKGEILALLGANGAGKSTLVMSLAGVLAHERGSIKLCGKDVGRWSAERRRRSGIAVAPEGHQTFRELSVLDHFRVAGAHLPRKVRNREIEAALQLFPELETRLQALGAHLSGGQKQMVIIAQALISRPSFLLVDELSLGLAPAIAHRLAQTLKEVAFRGVGILLIEQFTSLALAISTRASILERGSVLFEGVPRQLEEDPSILHPHGQTGCE